MLQMGAEAERDQFTKGHLVRAHGRGDFGIAVLELQLSVFATMRASDLNDYVNSLNVHESFVAPASHLRQWLKKTQKYHRW